MEVLSICIQHFALTSAIAELTRNATTFEFTPHELYGSIRKQAREQTLVQLMQTGESNHPRIASSMAFAERVVANGDEHTWRDHRIECCTMDMSMYVNGSATLQYVLHHEKHNAMHNNVVDETNTNTERETDLHYGVQCEQLAIAIEHVILDLARLAD